MNNPTENSAAKNPSHLAVGIALRFATIAFAFGVELAILFLAAGRTDWSWPWVWCGISLAAVLINGAFLLRTSPETAAERGRPKEVKRWDAIVSGLWGAAIYLALPLVAGLDAHWSWTRGLSVAWNVAGAVVYAAGLALFGWAMITNAYFSTAARIQTDRGQTVCRSGPYRIVRHPGYSGTILQALGTALLFGSLWSLIPAAAAGICMIVRTVLEDRMLQTELAGYRDFARDIPYRLVPGLW
jgi:protein-S-isoprenylcysteine O-methyltransferase Ste14